MKLGFICLGLPGHLNPMTALARQLQARNHEVIFLYSSGAGGLPFVRGPEKDHINEKLPEISKKQGLDALQFSLRAVLAQSEAILKTLPAVVQKNGVDALIIDAVQFYAELGAMQFGMPYVHVSTGVHHDHSGYTPLCLFDWPMRRLLQLWPEIEMVSHKRLTCWKASMGASRHMPRVSD